MKQAIGLYLSTVLSYFVFGFSVLSNLIVRPETTLGELLAAALLFTVIYLCAIALFLSLLNIMRAVFWIIVGYHKISLVIFPVLIIRNQTTLLRLAPIPTSLFENIYPSDFIEAASDNYNEKNISDIMIRCEVWWIFSQIMVLCAVSIFFVIFNFFYLLPAVVVVILPLCIFNCLNTEVYHGSLIRISNIKKGNLIYYLAINAITSSTRLIPLYKIAESRMCDDICKTYSFTYLKIRTLSHIYMLKTLEINIDYEILISTEALVNKLLDENKVKFNSAVGSEIWEFMKMYMCYSMACDKQESLEMVLGVMDRLFDRYHPLSFGSLTKINAIRELIQWYINVGRYKIIGNGSRNNVIRIDAFMRKFPTYQQAAECVVGKIENICEVTSGLRNVMAKNGKA